MTNSLSPSSPSSPSSDLRAVLFDSGGVLMRPIGGRWNPRADFEENVLAHDPSITSRRFAEAIAAGDRFMDDFPGTPDYDDYHRVLLGSLGLRPTPELLARLRRDVHPSMVLELFPDVLETLTELRRRGVRMAVVSDAWPDLPDLHAGLDIHDYFEVYAVSAVLGCEKPDPRMYRHASAGLGLDPSQCLFVDDIPELVSAAVALGYEGRALSRTATTDQVPADQASTDQASTDQASTDQASTEQVPSITTLTELLELFRP